MTRAKKKTLELLKVTPRISYAQLKVSIGKTRRQSIRIIKSLIDDGLIQKTNQGGTGWGPNWYSTRTRQKIPVEKVKNVTTITTSIHQLKHKNNTRSIKGCYTADEIRRGIQMKTRAKTVDQVLQSISPDDRTDAKVLAEFKSLPAKASTTGLFWRTQVHRHYPDTGVSVPLKMKEMGQVAQIMKLLSGDTLDILDAVIRDWPVFVKYFQQDYAVFTDPGLPQLKFVLLYPQSAHRLVRRSADGSKQPTLIQLPSTTVQTPTEALVKPEPADKPMTLSELNALEANG